MALNEPPSLSSRGLCLERWLDLDRLRSLDVAWPPAAAAVGPATSSSRVDGSGDCLFVLAVRLLLVGLPVMVLYSQNGRYFRLLTVTYNYHVGVTNFCGDLTHFSPKILSFQVFYLKQRQSTNTQLDVHVYYERGLVTSF